MELITLQKHNPQWLTIFDSERALISEVLKQNIYAIHHVGSTAIPGLLAKPIIDIAIEAITFPPSQAIIDALAGIEYEYKGEAGVEGRHWFIKGHPRKFNLHYCSVNSGIVKNQIKLRDALTKNEHLRKEYETLKLKNHKGKDIDSAEYALAKTSFIHAIIT